MAFRWGVGLGIVNAGWLYLSFWIGLHTSGLAAFQAVPAGWLVISVTGYILALRALAGDVRPTWGDGLRHGLAIALVGAVFAVLQQVGYYTIIHPEWPEYMVAQARDHFLAQGASDAEVAQRVEDARAYFTLRNYALQSAVSALGLGVILSVAVTGSLRFARRAR